MAGPYVEEKNTKGTRKGFSKQKETGPLIEKETKKNDITNYNHQGVYMRQN